MRPMPQFAIAFVLTAAAVTAAYVWIDRPVSYFAHAQLAQYRPIFHQMQRTPEFFASVAVVVFALAGYFVLLRRPLSRLLAVLLLSGVSLGVGAIIKDQLKFVFGRTWPETWINNNPSLIRDGVSGFNFFHGGAGYASFPSGHMTATCAVMSVLWLAYPRFRLLYGLVVAIVAIGLMGANYHFVSDIIAGAFIGWTVGWLAVRLWDAGGLPRVAAAPRGGKPGG
ncbi:MAG TPA: phosphatase PAP2 family protein [Xanthobacteraceae bacterium]|nr:phosphatase PAP2 family protein [Xanthobacteraceae bacterium]